MASPLVFMPAEKRACALSCLALLVIILSQTDKLLTIKGMMKKTREITSMIKRENKHASGFTRIHCIKTHANNKDCSYGKKYIYGAVAW